MSNSKRNQDGISSSVNEVLRPEELVRRENKAVNILRAALISVLIVVGTTLSYESYKLESRWEEDTYRREFKAIASRITSDFKTTVTDVMWTSYTLGAAVATSSDLVKAAPNLTIPNFDKLVAGVIQKFLIPAVYWAPLIRDEKQRIEWEAFAMEQINASESTGDNNACFVCGSKTRTVGVKDNMVVLPTGAYSCVDLEYSGLNGVIPQQYCSLVSAHVQERCACHEGEADESTLFIKQRAEPRLTRIYGTVDSKLDGNLSGPVQGPGPFSPIWQVYPSGYWASIAMYDLLSSKSIRGVMKAMFYTRKTMVSKFFSGERSTLLSPVVNNLGGNTSQIIGSVAFVINWVGFLETVVPFKSNGIHIVVENSCGQTRTFKSLGSNVIFLGNGDLHNPGFSSMMEKTSFDDYFTSQSTASPLYTGKDSPLNCAYRINVYSTEEFRSNFISSRPQLYATVVALIFLFTGLLFITYDCYVARRQRKVMKAVLQRDDIVSNLFPAAVRERLFSERQKMSTLSPNSLGWVGKSTLKKLTKIFRNQDYGSGLPTTVLSSSTSNVQNAFPKAEPIADFFPCVTVVFADIVGFTAWSSEREPSQVFQLLENVYRTFDQIASKHGVFKIETIGACYVAVAGLPVFQPDHAVRIVQFAHECVLHMHELTLELESALGPSTSSLTLSVGVHSGSVTAGVLRGEKCRFQLFGDTVNTTAQMQSSSENNRIHVSNATALLLQEAEKSNWLETRNTSSFKPRGNEQTYWANPINHDGSDDGQNQQSDLFASSQLSSDGGSDKPTSRLHQKLTKEKTQRLVEWNTDLLWRLLTKVVSARKPIKKCQASISVTSGLTQDRHHSPIDNITDVITMQGFSEMTVDLKCDPHVAGFTEIVRMQLLDYVAAIASMYHDNPFHNFEHASHVAMSTSKVVMRIIRPDVQHQETNLAHRKGRLAFKRKIHDSTFGISSDLLMHFAAAFSAVIHDVDHVGVSNAQLVRESHDLALLYNGKCVAEQNSVNIAWELLTQPQYRELLMLICPDETEMKRFYQLLVNAVIATDIADKELQQKRKSRWDKAFHLSSTSMVSEPLDAEIDIYRKATIVYEYIIQASDVAHTMQHWKVYLLWNERLFEERYSAYLCGREEHDPSVGWYKGEIWFFDNYIIPLAKKLETCGVFGVSSDEYLSYALENRHEWEVKGEEIVRNMMKKFGKADGLILDGVQEE